MKKFLSLVSLTAGMALSTTIHATTMVQLSTPQMVDAADTIVRGTITEVWTEEDANGIVWTRAQLEVNQSYKGQNVKDAYVIDQMGGRFGGNETTVGGRAQFSPGEEGIFFLEQLRSGRITTVGLSQGKYTVRLDPYSQEKIAQRYVAVAGKAYDHRFIPLPKQGDRLFVIDLVDTIEKSVAAGWNGVSIPGSNDARLERINRKEVTR
jgi:hypothetical protein